MPKSAKPFTVMDGRYSTREITLEVPTRDFLLLREVRPGPAARSREAKRKSFVMRGQASGFCNVSCLLDGRRGVAWVRGWRVRDEGNERVMVRGGKEKLLLTLILKMLSIRTAQQVFEKVP